MHYVKMNSRKQSLLAQHCNRPLFHQERNGLPTNYYARLDRARVCATILLTNWNRKLSLLVVMNLANLDSMFFIDYSFPPS